MHYNTPVEACEYAVANHDGDIVEIGAGYGETTIYFLAIAEKYNRKVIVIDPFELGWSDMPPTYRYAYDVFEGKTSKYKDRLILHKRNSLCKSSEAICSGTLAFAFIDGLQLKGSLLNDIRITNHAAIICLDDMDRETDESQVRSTLNEFTTNKTLTIKTRWAFLE